MQKQLSVMNNFAPLSSLPFLRTTGFRDFDKCPHTWALKFLRPDVKERRNIASNIGTAAHKIVEDTIRAANGEPDVDNTAEWLKVPPDEHAALMEYLTTILELPYRKILGIEHEFRIRVEGVGHNVKGTMDLVVELDDDTILIVDHKTNRGYDDVDHWRAEIQPLIYAMAARIVWPQYKVVKYTIGYVNLGTTVDWVTDPTEDEYVERRLVEWYDRMERYDKAGVWPMAAHADACRWCPISKGCPEHRRAIDMFQSSIVQIMHTTTVGERLQYVQMIRKLAEAKEAELKAEMSTMLESAPGGVVTEGGVEYSVQNHSERKLDPCDVIGSLTTWLQQDRSVVERVEVEHALRLLLTAKVGGVDALLKSKSPAIRELAQSVSTAVTREQGSPRLKARVLKPSEAAAAVVPS